VVRAHDGGCVVEVRVCQYRELCIGGIVGVDEVEIVGVLVQLVV
jgi:hypothetical protein